MYKIKENKFNSAIKKLKNIHILVIGDLILDEYLFGIVQRISPEAPVPVVWIRKEEITLGGAGNVVKNLQALGTQISIMARCGKDGNGRILESLFQKTGVPKNNLHLYKSSNIPTTIKTRVIAGHQQVCRVDKEEIIPLTEKEEKSIFSKFQKIVSKVDAVILSDYDKGFLTPNIIQNILMECQKKNILVSVDPQVSHFYYYKNATILTPNHHEAGKAIGKTLEDNHSIEEACREIYEKIHCKNLMITRGEKGMSIYQSFNHSIIHIPTVAKQVFDVTGAGDTVISIFTAFHSAGLDVIESSIVANAAAGVVVGKLGAATASIQEIHDNLKDLKAF